LKLDADTFAKLQLGQSRHPTALTNPVADMNINRMCHPLPLCSKLPTTYTVIVEFGLNVATLGSPLISFKYSIKSPRRLQVIWLIRFEILLKSREVLVGNTSGVAKFSRSAEVWQIERLQILPGDILAAADGVVTGFRWARVRQALIRAAGWRYEGGRPPGPRPDKRRHGPRLPEPVLMYSRVSGCSGGIAEDAGQIEQTSALGFWNRIVGANQLVRFLVGEHVTLRIASIRGSAFETLEEERHRNFQRGRDVPDAAGADAIRSGLVLLDLLKLDTDAVAKLQLGHPQHPTALTDPLSNMYVY